MRERHNINLDHLDGEQPPKPAGDRILLAVVTGIAVLVIASALFAAVVNHT